MSAIFLLVVLAGLGAFAVRLNSCSSRPSRRDCALGSVRGCANGSVLGSVSRTERRCMRGRTLNLTEGAAAGFRVSVQCTQTSHTEGTATVRVFVFDVRAEAGVYGGPDYVSRRVQAKVTDAV